MMCNVQWYLLSCVVITIFSLHGGHATVQDTVVLETNSILIYPDSKQAGYYYAHYYDGQADHFTCKRFVGTSVLLSFKSKSLDLQYATGYQTGLSVNVYVKLREANDGSTIVCSAYDNSYRIIASVVLTLHLKNYDTGLIAFQVNGMIPLRTKTNNSHEFYYEYRYFHGEIISIDLKIDKTRYISANCAAYGSVPDVLKDYIHGAFQTQYADIPALNLYNDNSGTYIHCITALTSNHNTIYHVKITFTNTTADYSPYIEGLQMSNILFQYWNGNNVIEYEIADQAIMIKCLSKKNMREGSFSFNNWEVSSSTGKYGLKSFELVRGVVRANVQCEAETEPTTVLQLVTKKQNDEISWNPLNDICAAELICTSIDYCTKDGYRSDELVVLTETERAARNPVSSCSTHGVTGVCCRKTHTTFQGFAPTRTAPGDPLTVPPSTFTALLPDTTALPPGITTVPPGTTSSTFSTSLADTSSTADSSVETNKSSLDDGLSHTLVVACSIVLVVVVLAGTLAGGAHYFYKRHVLKQKSNTPYENLPEHHEGPMATPSQWNQPDDVTYSHPVHENLYTTPVSKRFRNNGESVDSLNQQSLSGTYQNNVIHETNQQGYSERRISCRIV